uniref:VQ domain-containing protein n=1 Tax=Kalanchoe fedtschenkoi TaxID=63787 RepID=A0A7N0TY78_KALFE
MSQTFTGSADWSDYFHSTTASVFNADSATVATPTTHPNAATSFSYFKSVSGKDSNNSSINTRSTRVTKPARKRSRASRRTPTTMLSTDTSNFRAMVQQFTGGPSALPQARREQLSSSFPFMIPSGYSFQFQQQLQQGAYGGGGGGGGEVQQNVQSVDGGNINDFWY